LRTILERHGGLVEKFVGDAVMAVFGVPKAHEDDALRAVRAAVEMREAVVELGLEARIGVNTGAVVTGEGETLVTGDAVNVAARLEQAAEAGEILVGESTERLARGAVNVEQLEPIELKGKAERVAAYRLLEVVPDASDGAFARRLDAPLVGRSDELRTLERVLAIAFGTRRPQLATIVGVPGIGKSRLARELIQRAGARVLVGRCLSYGEGITYWPLAEIVEQIGDLGALFRDQSEARLVAMRVNAAVAESPGDVASAEIAWGFRKMFEASALEGPLIVVFDDIQWAEPTLLDLLENVATFARDVPLLLLCIARPELFDVHPGWASPKANAVLVTLDPLEPEEAETLVQELGQVSDDRRYRIIEAAEGNPLFVEQLIAAQAEGDEGDSEIPATIEVLLAARIDRLTAEERSVLTRAAIEGRTFHRGGVAALLQSGESAGVARHLMSLMRKQFLEPDQATVPGEDAFRFGHMLIRDAAYDSMPKRLRVDLHERFAEWLESKLGRDSPSEIVGYHFEQAYHYAIELSLDDDRIRSLALRAGRLLAQAGERACGRHDADAARSLLRRAIEALPEDDHERPPLLVLLGGATFDAGDVRRALEILRIAQRAAAAAAQRSTELAARMKELRYLLQQFLEQDTAAALAEAEAAINELREHDDPEALIAAWWVVYSVCNMRGDSKRMEKAAEQCLAAANQAGVRGEAASAIFGLVVALAQGPTHIEVAIRRAERAISDFPDERPAEGTLAFLYACAGRLEQAEELINDRRRIDLDLAQRLRYATSSMSLAQIALLAGRPERAEEPLREGAELLAAAGESSWMSTIAGYLAEVLYRLRRYDEAEEWTRRCDEAASPEDVLSQTMWRSTRAKVLARRGQAEHATNLAQAAVELARTSDSPQWIGNCLSDQGEVLMVLGYPNEARTCLNEALSVYELKGIVPSVEHVRTLLAEIAA
jgi:tetratricopeptide (TPR) repeat protein